MHISNLKLSWAELTRLQTHGWVVAMATEPKPEHTVPSPLSACRGNGRTAPRSRRKPRRVCGERCYTQSECCAEGWLKECVDQECWVSAHALSGVKRRCCSCSWVCVAQILTSIRICLFYWPPGPVGAAPTCILVTLIWPGWVFAMSHTANY